MGFSWLVLPIALVVLVGFVTLCAYVVGRAFRAGSRSRND